MPLVLPSAPDPEDEDQDSGDVLVKDDLGNVIRIEHDNGDVTISEDGKPIVSAAKQNAKWFDNLVEHIDKYELGRIADDLLRGVDDDKESRKDWVEERSRGIRLLGLSLENPTGSGAADGAPLDGMSKVRHPLLQEAVLRFQANARSELLPTDGPAKIRNDSNNAGLTQDSLANALEKDFNHYLTSVATEFYPDTDRMLLMLGFGGTAFKKVYFCPLRNRPVSEHVDADDLIVNNDATDLRNARRVTHRVYMKPSTVKRLQILGVYRDIDLSAPRDIERDAVQMEKRAQQGVSDTSSRPEDRDREIYECHCELDIPGYEHKSKGKETGLEIPYRVTIDVSTREILSIVRNYDEDTKELPESKVSFVKYTFVPGFGFYDIGLLNILGNTTMAATAAWRELLDLGMYANFPGFLVAKNGARPANTNIRIPPGGAGQVDTGGANIKDAIMPIPYQMQAAPALMSLVENMVEQGQRVGGTAEMPTGEGNADAPVGTTLALIEGATKVLNSVHKRMHAAQAEELKLIGECFKENPKSFWQKNRQPAYPWDEQTFLQALDDCNLIPQSDPNTASQIQRLMKLGALKALQSASPSLYDPIAIDQACIKALGFSNPEEFMAPPSAMGTPPPELVKMQQEGQAKLQDAQSKAVLAKAKADDVKAKAEIETARLHMDMNRPAEGNNGQQPLDLIKARTALMDAHTRARQVDAQQADTAIDAHNEAANRASNEHIEAMKIAKEVLQMKQDQAMEHQKLATDHFHRQNELAMNAHSERERMEFEDQHKAADRDARAMSESERLKAMAKAKNPNATG